MDLELPADLELLVDLETVIQVVLTKAVEEMVETQVLTPFLFSKLSWQLHSL